MTNHPLTDDLAESIAKPAKWPDDLGEVVFTYDDMRAAADWQLEQVIKYLEDHLLFVLWSAHPTDLGVRTYMDKFKKAMRPQENN